MKIDSTYKLILALMSLAIGFMLPDIREMLKTFFV